MGWVLIILIRRQCKVIRWSWAGLAGVNRRSVAELTLGFMLGLCHNVFKSGWALKQGQWVKEGGRLLAG